jgi:hypothetical protein
MNPRKNVTIQNNKININIMKEFLRIAYYEQCMFVLELLLLLFSFICNLREQIGYSYVLYHWYSIVLHR